MASEKKDTKAKEAKVKETITTEEPTAEKAAEYEEKISDSLKPYFGKLVHFLAYLCLLASLLTAALPESVWNNRMMAQIKSFLHIAALNVGNNAKSTPEAEGQTAE